MHYKIIYRIVQNEFSSTLKLEFNTIADSVEDAERKVQELAGANTIQVLEVYQRIVHNPETIVLPEDL